MLGLAIATAALLAGTILILPGSLKQSSPVGTDADIEEFMEWRDKIPPSSSVLMVPTRKSASFVWFTLGRTSYLSLGQSAGVVFSRETALEVRRRSEVLLPITAPDWKILSGMQARHARPQTAVPATHALTAASLAGICRDPQLGFVMTAEDVGLAPIARMRSGAWKDWSLYDCRSVRLN
jgi:hypothetical protein